ncbi:MAG TPA: L,D-transpeptidase family protein [Pyrinomonadaceae bacterium]|nr:L,D-transpeptidase family protein [Pyrinomonadaceae bacterium]
MRATSFLFKPILLLAIGVVVSSSTFASTTADKKKKHSAPVTRAEAKEAEQRLKDMGFWTGPIDGVVDGDTREALIAFQKIEGMEITGRLTRRDVDAIESAEPPQPKDPGYRHVEVDLDRQVLILVNDEGTVDKILPVSTGSGKKFNEKGIKGTAYTPRGRFRVYGKASGWKKSPLGLLYYPSYFSDGIAIHGNPEVPSTPASHGCIRVPMFAAKTVSRKLPVGTIVLVYDELSFVSAKDWANNE